VLGVAALIAWEEAVERGRAMWREVSSTRPRELVEIYLKLAVRRRHVAQQPGARPAVDEIWEAGVAVRLSRPGSGGAGFGSCTGTSSAAALWAASAANAGPQAADPPMPRTDAVPRLRTDLDPQTAMPGAEQIWAAFDGHPRLRWLELGTTIEVLIGANEWVAVRRRNRTWWESRARQSDFGALRGLSLPIDERPESDLTSGNANTLALSPQAAGTLISATARALYGLLRAKERLRPSWHLTDDPANAAGLAGGEFDDAGFATRPRVLADAGGHLGLLSGEGCYWRSSFRDPPRPSPSTLVLRAGERGSQPAARAVVERCRLLPAGRDDFFVEMGDPDSDDSPIYRLSPAEIAERCIGTWGTPRMTVEGVLTPGLIFSPGDRS
jgi:hypothetical protein